MYKDKNNYIKNKSSNKQLDNIQATRRKKMKRMIDDVKKHFLNKYIICKGIYIYIKEIQQ